jgi:hypothetical protein
VGSHALRRRRDLHRLAARSTGDAARFHPGGDWADADKHRVYGCLMPETTFEIVEVLGRLVGRAAAARSAAGGLIAVGKSIRPRVRAIRH